MEPGQGVCGGRGHLAPDTQQVDGQVSCNPHRKGVGLQLLVLLGMAGQLPNSEGTN